MDLEAVAFLSERGEAGVDIDPTCQKCSGSGSVVERREARMDDLSDIQFRFLLEAMRVMNGTDDESQSQQQNQEELERKAQLSQLGPGAAAKVPGGVDSNTRLN